MKLEGYLVKESYILNPRDKTIFKGPLFLNKKRVVIGRSNTCDVVVDDPSVSGFHSIIEVVDNKFQIFDLNSSNGVLVNGKKILDIDLHLQDVIQLGNQIFTLEKYDKNKHNPILDMLGPDVPPVIVQEVPVSKESIKEKNMPQNPVAHKRPNEAIPRIVYPLKLDPKSEFSEYIFEDNNDLIPIFKFDYSRYAIEVVILYFDDVLSVSYIPFESGIYKLCGANPGIKDIEFPYLAKTENFPFIEVSGHEVFVSSPHGFDPFYLTEDGKITRESKSNFVISGDEVVMFDKGDLKLFVRGTSAPPDVDLAPLFRRDKQFLKYLMIMFILIFSFMVSSFIYEVDEEIEKQKTPERIAQILYKRKLIAKTPPKKLIKIPKTIKKAKPKLKPKKPQAVKKKTKKVVKKSQDKAAEKKLKFSGTQKNVKKTKAQDQTKAKGISKSFKKGGRSQGQPSKRRYSPVNKKSKGHVDTYKSANFSSTINKLLSKGGSTRGVKASAYNNTESGFTNLPKGGANQGDLKKAKVGSSVGNLEKAVSGKLVSSTGAEGLVDKRSFYTADIPSRVVVAGSMDPNIIRQILLENLMLFQSCYQRTLDRSARKFNGTIGLNFTIGASGAVTAAGVARDSGLPAKVKKCVVGVLKGILFPEPIGGGTVNVKVPMNFYSQIR